MKKSLIVVIVILSIVILGLSTFIVYDKDLLGIKRESKKESNDVVEKSDDIYKKGKEYVERGKAAVEAGKKAFNSG